MKRYVLGFAFDGDGRVVLMRKCRPSWQRGYWNGVGGAQRENEFFSRDAMAREFEEETGVKVAADRWQHVGTLYHPDETVKDDGWHVTIFKVTLTSDDGEPDTITDETVWWWNMGDLDGCREMLHNVPMLVRLCEIPADHTGKVPTFNLRY